MQEAHLPGLLRVRAHVSSTPRVPMAPSATYCSQYMTWREGNCHSVPLLEAQVLPVEDSRYGARELKVWSGGHRVWINQPSWSLCSPMSL